MNEVRMVCAHMLDGPESPMRDADEILALARRAQRRRGRLTVALVTAVASGVMGVVVLLGSGLVAVRSPDGVAGPGSVPAARAPASHGKQMALSLLAAVDSRYVAVPETTFSDGEAIYPVALRDEPQILAGAVVRVFAGEREGQLYAYLVHDGHPLPSGDLCAPSLGPATPAQARCEVRTVAGVPIRVVTFTDPQRGQVTEATRFLVGGRLVVGADQGVSLQLRRLTGTTVTGSEQSLPGPPLDEDRVAALAADPAMLPGS